MFLCIIALQDDNIFFFFLLIASEVYMRNQKHLPQQFASMSKQESSVWEHQKRSSPFPVFSPPCKPHIPQRLV